MANFDDNGDLWIEVDVNEAYKQLPRDMLTLYSTVKDLGGGTYAAVTMMNLTAYICKLTGVARR